MSEILLYHGSKEEVVYPEIRITRYTKDFSWGFYCTNSYQQAYRWADRRSADGIVNVYRYVENSFDYDLPIAEKQSAFLFPSNTFCVCSYHFIYHSSIKNDR